MRRIRDLNGAAGNAPASPVSADHLQTRCLAGTAARPPVLTVELRPTLSWAGICEQWSKYYAPKFILGFHRCNCHRRFGRSHRRAGCATLSGVRRNQGGLQAGGIYSGPCQDRRLWIASRQLCGERRSHAEPASLCRRSIRSLWRIAKRRTRTSAKWGATRSHRNRPRNQLRRTHRFPGRNSARPHRRE